MNDAVFQKICSRLAEGRSLRSICRDEDIPITESSVREAVMKDEVRSAQYTRARDLGLDSMADELLDIAHDSSNDWMTVETERGEKTVLNYEHVQRSKLRTDTLKWYLSKLASKRYGDKLQTDVTSSDGSLKGMSQDQIAHKLNAILISAQKRLEAAKAQTGEGDLDALVDELV